MDARTATYHGPNCHRCNMPMVLHSVQAVGDKLVQVFRCEGCETLEATKCDDAAQVSCY